MIISRRTLARPVHKFRGASPTIDGWGGDFIFVDWEKCMLKIKTMSGAFVAILVLAVFYSPGSGLLLAQNAPATAHSSPAKLTEQETRGENLFRQRCSLCHLPRKLKFGSPAVVGPDLTGVFKEASPDKLKLLT